MSRCWKGSEFNTELMLAEVLTCATVAVESEQEGDLFMLPTTLHNQHPACLYSKTAGAAIAIKKLLSTAHARVRPTNPGLKDTPARLIPCKKIIQTNFI
jgi:hypothetical protein